MTLWQIRSVQKTVTWASAHKIIFSRT